MPSVPPPGPSAPFDIGSYPSSAPAPIFAAPPVPPLAPSAPFDVCSYPPHVPPAPVGYSSAPSYTPTVYDDGGYVPGYTPTQIELAKPFAGVKPTFDRSRFASSVEGLNERNPSKIGGAGLQLQQQHSSFESQVPSDFFAGVQPTFDRSRFASSVEALNAKNPSQIGQEPLQTSVADPGFYKGCTQSGVSKQKRKWAKSKQKKQDAQGLLETSPEPKKPSSTPPRVAGWPAGWQPHLKPVVPERPTDFRGPAPIVSSPVPPPTVSYAPTPVPPPQVSVSAMPPQLFSAVVPKPVPPPTASSQGFFEDSPPMRPVEMEIEAIPPPPPPPIQEEAIPLQSEPKLEMPLKHAAPLDPQGPQESQDYDFVQSSNAFQSSRSFPQDFYAAPGPQGPPEMYHQQGYQQNYSMPPHQQWKLPPRQQFFQQQPYRPQGFGSYGPPGPGYDAPPQGYGSYGPPDAELSSPPQRFPRMPRYGPSPPRPPYGGGFF
ncbi:hypothetical protein L596_025904 [Steinernema carpocapsae]|uniref:Uncharacterized protein n=1 Tax=Steinernema carpocapsae TaxID=34508 RepID=A0A4U5M9D8_STECR|nr:hypothetical protein L596_025904 [Steinernema carpocapsae]